MPHLGQRWRDGSGCSNRTSESSFTICRAYSSTFWMNTSASSSPRSISCRSFSHRAVISGSAISLFLTASYTSSPFGVGSRPRPCLSTYRRAMSSSMTQALVEGVPSPYHSISDSSDASVKSGPGEVTSLRTDISVTGSTSSCSQKGNTVSSFFPAPL